jgi:hypothetical protein
MSTFTHYRVHNDNQAPDIDAKCETKETTTNYTDDLLKMLKIEVTELDEESIQFDLVGVDVSLANALRRIMMAEVGAQFFATHRTYLISY